MNAMTEIKPLFEEGKTYKTRDGLLVKNVRPTHRNMWRGFIGDDRINGRLEYLWLTDGRVSHAEESAYDLMPGAIEDEAKFEVGKHYRTRDGRIGAITANDHHHSYPLLGYVDAQLHRWKLTGSWVDTDTADLDLVPGAIEDEPATLYGLDLKSVVDALHRDVSAQIATIASMAAKIEDLQGTIANLNKKIDEHGGIRPRTFNSLLHYLGVEVDDYGRVRVKPPEKPTIKGGWVNVYKHSLSMIHATREGADHEADSRRIACIQIPDITEGEGL